MIKLFEEYKINDLFDDIELLIRQLLLKNNNLFKESKYSFFIKKNDKPLFKLHFDGVDLLFGYFDEYIDEGIYYLSLDKYLYSKISPYYDGSKFGDGQFFSVIKDFDIKNIIDFNISIDDYERFIDTERFGL